MVYPCYRITPQVILMKRINFSLICTIFCATAAANTPIPDASPVASGQHVIINIPQQRLFLFNDGKLVKAYPVAVGKAATQTTLGEHKIGAKAFNPTWHIPKSIQKERGDGVKTVPPGPQNPLGPVFVRMGDPKLGLGIHGTNAPASVPGVRSHGCVRMKSPDALEFAKTIHSGSPVSVVYQMATLNVDANNHLWLAVYRDPYNQKNLDAEVLRKSINAWVKAHGKSVNPKRVAAILKNRTGSPNCLTCKQSVKMKVPLKSIAWTTGSALPTKPKAIPVEPPKPKDEILPPGTEIEVDAESTTPSQTPKNDQPSTQPAQNAKKDLPEKVTNGQSPQPVTPKNGVRQDFTEPTDTLF